MQEGAGSFLKTNNPIIAGGCRRQMNQTLSFPNLPDGLKLAVIERDLPADVAFKLSELNNPFVNEKMVQILKRKKKYEKDLLKNALFAVEKSKTMKKKFQSLKKITDMGVILSSIWEFGNRDNYAGDPTFYGNAPTQVVEQCILRLTKKNDVVVDPMAGSGTTIDVCKTYGRKYKAFDLSPIRKEIIENDSRKMPLKDNSVNLVFFHPPYWNMVRYSKKPEDLSSCSLKSFYESTEQVLKESYRVLKKGSYLCILIGDLVENGEYISLTRKVANIAETVGLKDCGNAIKITKGAVSEIRRGKAIYAELAKSKNLKQNHDTVLFWKK